MRVVFMGSSVFAEPSLRSIHASSHQIVSVVTHADKTAGRGKKLQPSYIKSISYEFGYPVLQPVLLKDEQFIRNLKDCFSDIFVVVAFRKLPDILLDIPKLGCINLHPSLLPKYRGAAPIHHSILNGDKKTGITVIKISSQLDSGDILFQKEYTIIDNENTGELSNRLSDYGSKHLVETLNLIEEKNEITGVKQDESIVSLAPKIHKNDYMVSWTDDAINIHNKIRALAPKPGAFSMYGKKRMKLIKSEVILTNIDFIQSDDILREHLLNLHPGQILMTKNKIFTGTGNGILSILEIQPEGKRVMKNSEFISGYYEKTSNFD